MFISGRSQNPYATETLFEQFYTYDQNPNSTQEEPPFMLDFPSPFLDHHELPLSHILPQQQPMTIHCDVVVDQNEKSKSKSINKGKYSSMEIANEALMEPKPCEVNPAIRRNLDATLRKRTGKKDRHSKICTAQGVRDRRMRLSLQIARKFFDLQDMLGFDKASKTIEWLFSKSKKAIEELSMDLPQTMDNSSSEEKSESLMSECEVVATGMEEYFNSEAKNGMAANDVTLVENPNVKSNKNLRNSAYNHHYARESREMARARARERSREKMMIKHLENTEHSNNLDQLRSFSPFETLEESTYYTQKSSLHEADSHSIHHQSANVGIIEKCLGTENLTQIAGPKFSYQNNAELSLGIDSSTNSMGLLGNWDANSARINSSNGAVMNMVSLAGNPTSTCLATSNFPFLLQ